MKMPKFNIFNIFKIVCVFIFLIFVCLNVYRLPGCNSGGEINAKYEYGSNEVIVETFKEEEKPIFRVENTKDAPKDATMMEVKFKIKGEGRVILKGEYLAKREMLIDGIHEFTIDTVKNSKVNITWVSYDSNDMDIEIRYGIEKLKARNCPKGELDFKATTCFMSSLF